MTEPSDANGSAKFSAVEYKKIVNLLSERVLDGSIKGITTVEVTLDIPSSTFTEIAISGPALSSRKKLLTYKSALSYIQSLIGEGNGHGA